MTARQIECNTVDPRLSEPHVADTSNIRICFGRTHSPTPYHVVPNLVTNGSCSSCKKKKKKGPYHRPKAGDNKKLMMISGNMIHVAMSQKMKSQLHLFLHVQYQIKKLCSYLRNVWLQHQLESTVYSTTLLMSLKDLAAKKRLSQLKQLHITSFM